MNECHVRRDSVPQRQENKDIFSIKKESFHQNPSILGIISYFFGFNNDDAARAYLEARYGRMACLPALCGVVSHGYVTQAEGRLSPRRGGIPLAITPMVVLISEVEKCPALPCVACSVVVANGRWFPRMRKDNRAASRAFLFVMKMDVGILSAPY